MTSVYIAQHPLTAARELAGEMLVISSRDSRLLTLNEVGTAIWKAADGRTTLDDIVQRVVCAEFEVDVPAACADAEQFVQELADAGVLVVSTEPIADTAPLNDERSGRR